MASDKEIATAAAAAAAAHKAAVIDPAQISKLKGNPHGGPRPGAGRKTSKSYDKLAASGFEYLENVLTENIGEQWKAKPKEKEAIVNATSEILETWDITDFSNPYLALIGASVIYAFGKDRLESKNIFHKIGDAWSSWREKRKAKK